MIFYKIPVDFSIFENKTPVFSAKAAKLFAVIFFGSKAKNADIAGAMARIFNVSGEQNDK